MGVWGWVWLVGCAVLCWAVLCWTGLCWAELGCAVLGWLEWGVLC